MQQDFSFQNRYFSDTEIDSDTESRIERSSNECELKLIRKNRRLNIDQ